MRATIACHEGRHEDCTGAGWNPLEGWSQFTDPPLDIPCECPHHNPKRSDFL